MIKFLEKAKGVNGFFHKAALMAAVALAGGSVFAADAAIDTTAASGALSSMVDAVKGFITTAIPYVVGLLGVALGATLVWVAWKWIKKGSSKAG